MCVKVNRQAILQTQSGVPKSVINWVQASVGVLVVAAISMAVLSHFEEMVVGDKKVV